MSVEPVHDGLPHEVPLGCTEQAPAPSQLPVVPQVEGACAAQSPAGAGPAATLPQTPLLPEPLRAALQALHTALHAVSQQ